MPAPTIAGVVDSTSAITASLIKCSYFTLDTLRALLTQDGIPQDVRSEAIDTIAAKDEHAVYQWDPKYKYFCPVISIVSGNNLARRIRALLTATADLDIETLEAMADRGLLRGLRESETITYYALDGHRTGGLWRGFHESHDYACVFTNEEHAVAYWEDVRKMDRLFSQTAPQIVPVTFADLRARGFTAVEIEGAEFQIIAEPGTSTSSTLCQNGGRHE